MKCFSGERNMEMNDIAPSSLSHLIGQRGVIDQVSVALDAAFADGQENGLGLARRPARRRQECPWLVSIAAEMATELARSSGQSITDTGALNALLLSAKDKDVVHIDECHELNKEFQTALYLAVDQRKILLNSKWQRSDAAEHSHR